MVDKHGRWIINFDHFAPYQRCSSCEFEMPVIAGEDIEIALYRYCPDCGARMDEEESA